MITSNHKSKAKPPAIFCNFVKDATSGNLGKNDFWEELRRQTRFKSVDAMFARWQQLAGIKKPLAPKVK